MVGWSLASDWERTAWNRYALAHIGAAAVDRADASIRSTRRALAARHDDGPVGPRTTVGALALLDRATCSVAGLECAWGTDRHAIARRDQRPSTACALLGLHAAACARDPSKHAFGRTTDSAIAPWGIGRIWRCCRIALCQRIHRCWRVALRECIRRCWRIQRAERVRWRERIGFLSGLRAARQHQASQCQRGQGFCHSRFSHRHGVQASKSGCLSGAAAMNAGTSRHAASMAKRVG